MQQIEIVHVADENDIDAVQLDATYEFRRTLKPYILKIFKLL